MFLELWQAWGIKDLSRKPVLGFDHPHSKEVFHHVQPDPPLEHLCAISMCPVIGEQGAEI